MVHVHPGKVTVASPLAVVLAWIVISGSTRSCRPVVAGKDLKLEQEHKGAWPIAVLQMSSLSVSACRTIILRSLAAGMALTNNSSTAAEYFCLFLSHGDFVAEKMDVSR